MDLLHGVQHGSVLGSLLFLILINDLDIEDPFLLFAGDTTLVTRGREIDAEYEESVDIFRGAISWF